MRVVSAKFLLSAMEARQFPRDGRPEFAFAGRSNVGKSSLLNRLLNRKGLAKTSSTPGKTQTINFFDVNERIYLVDLPGYGFAKVPLALKNQWQALMAGYLREREPLRLVVQLLDARHPPSDKDIEMLELLDAAEVPTLLVATKVDKLKRSQRQARLNEIRKTLELDEEALIIPASSETGEGIPDIWSVIEDNL